MATGSKISLMDERLVLTGDEYIPIQEGRINRKIKAKLLQGGKGKDGKEGPVGPIGPVGPQGPAGPSGVQLGDVALVNELDTTPGSEKRAISQQIVSKELNELNKQVDLLIASNANLTIQASPLVLFHGEDTTITVTAKLDGAVSNLVLKRNGTVIQNAGETNTISVTDTIADTAIYTAEAIVRGKLLTALIKSIAYYPMFIGAGVTHDDVADIEQCKIKPPKPSPTGDYKINVKAGQRVFVVIPATMNLDTDHVTLSGFLFPMSLLINDTIYGTEYKIYSSGVIDETRTLTIKIG